MLNSERQLPNALPPILVTLFGIVMCVSDVQLKNVPALTLVRLFGKVTFFSAVQY